MAAGNCYVEQVGFVITFLVPFSQQSDMLPFTPSSFYRSVDEGSDLTLDINFRIRIDSNGLVTCIPAFRWRTACSVDLTYFPFDRQTCYLQLK